MTDSFRSRRQAGSTRAWRRRSPTNTARLAIVGDNPMLLSGEDASKVARASKANSDGLPAGAGEDRQFRHQLEHHRLSEPVLGDAGVPRGFLKRWRSASWRTRSFAASRVDRGRRGGQLGEATTRCCANAPNWLNGQRFRALHYSGPGTDLTIGLADGHEWEGGAWPPPRTASAATPTSRPRKSSRRRIAGGSSGHVDVLEAAVLSGHADRQHRGDASRTGRIVEAKASRGEEVLNKVLDTDEGARRLGEVALVPRTPRRSRKSGLLFFNTLFDENAASHIALGQCYSKCFIDGAQADAAADRRAGRQPEPDPYRLDDRLKRDRHRWRSRRRKPRAGIPQGRVGLRRLPACGAGKLIAKARGTPPRAKAANRWLCEKCFTRRRAPLRYVSQAISSCGFIR